MRWLSVDSSYFVVPTKPLYPSPPTQVHGAQNSPPATPTLNRPSGSVATHHGVPYTMLLSERGTYQKRGAPGA